MYWSKVKVFRNAETVGFQMVWLKKKKTVIRHSPIYEPQLQWSLFNHRSAVKKNSNFLGEGKLKVSCISKSVRTWLVCHLHNVMWLAECLASCYWSRCLSVAPSPVSLTCWISRSHRVFGLLQTQIQSAIRRSSFRQGQAGSEGQTGVS